MTLIKSVFGESLGPLECEAQLPAAGKCGKPTFDVYYCEPLTPRDVRRGKGFALCADHAPKQFKPSISLASIHSAALAGGER